MNADGIFSTYIEAHNKRNALCIAINQWCKEHFEEIDTIKCCEYIDRKRKK